MGEGIKKGIWEKNLGSKEQETLHVEFPLQVSKYPLWISQMGKYATNINWALAENVLP